MCFSSVGAVLCGFGVLLFLDLVQGQTNNVCKTLPDYATLYYNKNCWYNPDVDATPVRIAERYGFPFETHQVITADKYILTLFRIPHGSNSSASTNEGTRQPVLLQHGIAMHGIVWFIIGKNSPAFYLANNGYDVWIANSRGTKPSSEHLNYTINDPEYWNFSFHEIGIFDLPAVIDYISGRTGQRGRIIYIGHSMGTTASFVYASVRRHHAKRSLKGIVALAPVAYMKHVRSPVRILAPLGPLIQNFLALFNLHGLGQFPQLQRAIMKNTCNLFPTIIGCHLINTVIAGLSLQEVQPQYLPVFFNNYPAGTSVKTLQHFAQILEANGRFQWYDYGSQANLLLYNSTQPRSYKLDKINVPMHLFYGKNDFLSCEKDVETLYEQLHTEKTVRAVKAGNESDFAHNDFLFGKHIDALFQEVIVILKKRLR